MNVSILFGNEVTVNVSHTSFILNKLFNNGNFASVSLASLI